MTASEAQLYLPVSENESLEEAFDEKLFEWKIFFVNRFPVTKLYLKKVDQLHLLQEAYNVLGGENNTEPTKSQISVSFSSNLKEAFQQYSEIRNQIKVRLFAAKSAKEIAGCAMDMVQLTRDYASVWRLEDADLNDVIVSKEFDPMDLLNALNDAEKSGVMTVNQISDLPADHLLINEAKRLSLWIKMDEDGGR